MIPAVLGNLWCVLAQLAAVAEVVAACLWAARLVAAGYCAWVGWAANRGEQT